MTINQPQPGLQQNNVVSLRKRQGENGGSPEANKVPNDSLPVRCRSPKESVEVVRKVEVQKPGNNYSRKKYPGEYRNWDNMKQRCKKGNGVLDPRFEKFPDFMLHMSPKPGKRYSIDRKDHTNPEYSPENCRWASKTLQTRNRGCTRILTDNTGRAQTAAEWTSKPGSVSANTMLGRIYNGWPEHDAIHCPKGYQYKKYKTTQQPSTNTGELVTLYEQKLRGEHKQGFVCVQPKHKKMLKDISRDLEAGGIPSLPALALALEEWSEFKIYAEKRYGAFKPPVVPNAEYLTRALTAIGNFYLKHLQQVEEANTRQQQQTLFDDQQHAQIQQAEQRRAFIEYYLNANPEYKQLQDRLLWLTSVKDQPNSGMDRNHFNEYAASLSILEDHKTESEKQEFQEQWIEHAMKDTSQNWHQRVWRKLNLEIECKLRVLLKEDGLQDQVNRAYERIGDIHINHCAD